MPSPARNLANFLGTGNTTVSASKLSADVPRGTENYSDINSLGVGTNIGQKAFIQETNRLYIWNGSGWYNIAVINETPTWDSGGEPLSSYTLDPDSPQSSTIITLAASDPEGFPISYSYVTGGSFDSIATVSQDSTVFTITPKTVSEVGEGVELTGSITFNVTDNISILSKLSSFTLSFISIIENSRYTTLLLDVVDTSDNNDITDSSSNNVSITSYGNATAGTFSPYHGVGYSGFFNGGQELRYQPYTAGDYNLGTSNFTMEAWAYTTANSATQVLFSQRRVSNGGPQIRVTSSGTVQYFYFNGNNAQNSTAIFPVRQWNHVALVRSGTGADQTKVYLNGVEILSFQEAANFSNTAADLTIGNFSLYSEPWYGYIADVRIVKDAVYTSDFSNSLPTETLTAINNTIFLTTFNSNSSNYYFDDITGNGRVTSNLGSTSVVPVTRFDSLEYRAADNGGSIYFDGSGDYLRADAALSSFTSSTSTYTIEAYIYPTAAYNSSNDYFFGINRSSDGYNNLLFSRGGIYSNNTAVSLSSTIGQNIWSHVALTNDGTTLRAFVNGSIVASTTTLPQALSTCVLGFGAEFDTANGGTPGNYYTGYMSDIRISNTALYTSAFSPSFSPFTTPSGTVLHIKGTDASLIDKSQNDNLRLFGNTTGSTAQAKFANTKSMYFDGTGDYVVIQNSSVADFKTGDFTIETWVYCEDTNTNQIIETRPSNTNGAYVTIAVQAGSGVYFYTNTTHLFTGTNGRVGTINTGQWHHVAWVRYNGTITAYIDGVSVGSASNSTNFIRNRVTIGWNAYVGENTGSVYIQDLRITKDLARYTANFTPPTEPFKG
jgi:hypothetical protein